MDMSLSKLRVLVMDMDCMLQYMVSQSWIQLSDWAELNW